MGSRTIDVNARLWRGRSIRYARAFLLFCLLLFAATSIYSTQLMARAQTVDLEQLAAFSSLRHADTIDTRESYGVSVRQLAGPEVRGGQAAYSVWNIKGKKIAEGQAEMRPERNSDGWIAEIPGQPIGSTIGYHFYLTTLSGERLRHPARPQTYYRFRVVAVKIRSVTLPKPGAYTGEDQQAVLRIQANSRPAGELVLRLLPASPEAAREQRITLTVKPEKSYRVDRSYVMKATLPDLRPGELIDFYFQIRTSQGKVKHPANAPAHTYTLKRSFKNIQSLNDDSAFVLDVSAVGQQRWVGLKGGGVWTRSAKGQERHWGLSDGMPSGVARFVLTDPVSRYLYVGTDRGLTEIETGKGSTMSIVSPYPSAWNAGLDALNRFGRSGRVGPGALSTLDGTLLFQIQKEQLIEEAYPATLFLQFQDARLSKWNPSVDFPLLGMSSANFDSVDGCWLLGGYIPRGKQNVQPVVLRHCGVQVNQILLQDFTLGSLRAIPERVFALVRDPSTGSLVVGLEYSLTNGAQRQKYFGVYRVDDTSGQLSPLAPEIAAIGDELTSLATDWVGGRILVGKFGRPGLLQIRKGTVQPVNSAQNVPSEVTSIEITTSGSILIGTSRGAFELSSDGTTVLPFGPRGKGFILTNALPMDEDPITGRILLSSYSNGLALLERGKDGRWRAVENLRPEHELPSGLFGDAQFISTGGVSVIMHSQGLLQVKNNQVILIGPADGLYSRHLLRLLSYRLGETWLSYTPMPFGSNAGAALQVLQGDKVVRTIKIGDRNLATIGRWIGVQERKSIFAATRAGVVEIDEDGTITRLSKNSASSIARDSNSGVIGAVGTAIERWDGKRFSPVLFRVDHPRWQKGEFYTGAPIDLAIDKTGTWYVLFRDGILALLDSEGHFLNLLDPEDGIPPTAQRLLAHSVTGDIFVGSSSESLFVIARHDRLFMAN